MTNPVPEVTHQQSTQWKWLLVSGVAAFIIFCGALLSLAFLFSQKPAAQTLNDMGKPIRLENNSRTGSQTSTGSVRAPALMGDKATMAMTDGYFAASYVDQGQVKQIVHHYQGDMVKDWQEIVKQTGGVPTLPNSLSQAVKRVEKLGKRFGARAEHTMLVFWALQQPITDKNAQQFVALFADGLWITPPQLLQKLGTNNHPELVAYLIQRYRHLHAEAILELADDFCSDEVIMSVFDILLETFADRDEFRSQRIEFVKSHPLSNPDLLTQNERWWSSTSAERTSKVLREVFPTWNVDPEKLISRTKARYLSLDLIAKMPFDSEVQPLVIEKLNQQPSSTTAWAACLNQWGDASLLPLAQKFESKWYSADLVSYLQKYPDPSSATVVLPMFSLSFMDDDKYSQLAMCLKAIADSGAFTEEQKSQAREAVRRLWKSHGFPDEVNAVLNGFLGSQGFEAESLKFDFLFGQLHRHGTIKDQAFGELQKMNLTAEMRQQLGDFLQPSLNTQPQYRVYAIEKIIRFGPTDNPDFMDYFRSSFGKMQQLLRSDVHWQLTSSLIDQGQGQEMLEFLKQWQQEQSQQLSKLQLEQIPIPEPEQASDQWKRWQLMLLSSSNETLEQIAAKNLAKAGDASTLEALGALLEESESNGRRTRLILKTGRSIKSRLSD